MRLLRSLIFFDTRQYFSIKATAPRISLFSSENVQVDFINSNFRVCIWTGKIGV